MFISLLYLCMKISTNPVLFLLRMKDIELFRQVYTHPSYAENPRGTIHEHLQNKLKQENEMDL